MLNEIEEKRKNELLDELDNKTITTAELSELRELTNKGISHLKFSNITKIA